MSYIIKTKNTESILRLAPGRPKTGAYGEVYSIVGTDDFVFKKYKKGAAYMKIMLPKLEHFIANPPKFSAGNEEVLGVKFHELAWPKHIVYERNKPVGFLMPKVNFDESVSLNQILSTANRKKHNIPEDINWRILVAKNLAATYAALHAEKYYVIDTKPANILAYKKFQGVTMIDCDGFLLEGTPFTGDAISDEYIAPELNPKNVDKVARRQDIFALSVLIFRLFNNNIHPFSGVLKVQGDFKTQERINKGAYPYGSSGSSIQDPNPTSMHHLFPDKLAKMFDEIFGQGKRPEASEWVALLEGLRDARGQSTCAKHLFKTFKRGCSLCELDRITGKARPTYPGPAEEDVEEEELSVDLAKPPPDLTKKPSFQKPKPTNVSPVRKSKDNGVLWILGLSVVVVIFINWNSGKNKGSPVTVPPSSPTTVAQKSCDTSPAYCSETDLCHKGTKVVSGRRVWETDYFKKYADEAKRRGFRCDVTTGVSSVSNQNCWTTPSACNNEELCKRATLQKGDKLEWDLSNTYIAYANEAKRRGLWCNVNQNNSAQQNNETELSATGPWRMTSDKRCRIVQYYNNTDYPHAEISVFKRGEIGSKNKGGLGFTLFTSQTARQFNDSNVTIKVNGKPPFKVDAENFNTPDRGLKIFNLSFLKKIFMDYSYLKISDGVTSVRVPLNGSKNGILELERRCKL